MTYKNKPSVLDWHIKTKYAFYILSGSTWENASSVRLRCQKDYIYLNDVL